MLRLCPRNSLASLALAAALWVLAACTSSDPPAPRPLSSAEAAALANLDRSLLTCTIDSSCPRGSHCALGACSYECSADTPCAPDLTCDPTGRCR